MQEIFTASLELPATERAGFVQAACGGDPTLFEEVMSLLAFEGSESPFGAAVAEVAGSLSGEPVSRVGERLGAYRLIQEIGRGGMGTVYLAQRADAEFQKQVAIKIVRRGMDTEDVLARFRWERQILANLVHSNIALMHDGGATPDGLPYLVMEYVEGETLTAYCTSRRLPVAERLRLFLEVCEGVAHAHRNLIVHRDLKPANILVNTAGQVKLLDFGIAKLLDPAAGMTGMQHTVAGRMFTPEYASPEQVWGAPVTTSTDVYSLGVVLFELLTDERPHRLEAYTEGELQRVICEQESPRASTLAHGLSAELDSIVAMALRKEPERRYRSVEELAADIRRYLTGFPVLARGDSVGYRAGRFMRRNRVLVGSAVLALAGLVAGLGVAVYQAKVARESAARAERRFGQLRELANSMIFEHYDRIRGLPGSTGARFALVRTALQYLDSLYAEAGNDDALKVEMARAYERIGDVQGLPGQGNQNKLVEAAESYGKARRLLDSVLAGQPNDVKALGALSRLIPKQATLTLELEGPEKVAGMSAERLQVAERLAAMQPESAGARSGLAQAHAQHAQALLDAGDEVAAIASCGRSVETGRASEQKHGTEAARSTLASVLLTCGQVQMRAGRLEEAMSNLRELIRLQEELNRVRANYSPYPRRLYVAHWYMGYALGSGEPEPHLERPAEAVAALRLALGVAERLSSAAGGQDTTAQRDVAMAEESLGKALLAVDPAKGLEHLRRAVMLFQKLALSMKLKRADLALGWAKYSLGIGLRRHGRQKEARQYLEQAQAIMGEHLTGPGERFENRLGYAYLLRELALLRAGTDVRGARERLAQAAVQLDGLYKDSPQPRVSAALAQMYESDARLEKAKEARCGGVGQSRRLWEALEKQGAFVAAARSAQRRLEGFGCGV
ncbi:MAG: serine/threonine protein kinase [Bryobacterales bacterium]|nr:serine/threonine protein kinase [Bryobacterales bacterium]